MSDSVQLHRQQPTRLPRPWDSQGKNTGVGCHFLLQCMKVKSLSCVWLLVTPWTSAYQAPPSMGFSRQKYWSGLSLPSPLYILRVLNVFLIDTYKLLFSFTINILIMLIMILFIFYEFPFFIYSELVITFFTISAIDVSCFFFSTELI